MVVVDIDLTLYNYREFILAQKGNFKSLLNALFYYNEELLIKDVDKTWLKYQFHIEKRIEQLINKYEREHLFFYSAYPITEIKKKSFDKFNIHALSSYPEGKLNSKVLEKIPENINLVIGDRPVDKELASKLNAFWRGFTFSHPAHFENSISYTQCLSDLTENLKPQFNFINSKSRYFFFLFFLSIMYLLVGQASSLFFQKGYYFNLEFPFEKNIPFVSSWVYIYALYYPIYLTPLFLNLDKKEISRIAKCMGLLSLVAWAHYLLVPLPPLMRPSLENSHFSESLLGVIFSTDVSACLFPSLHVAQPFLLGLIFKNLRSSLRPLGHFFIFLSLLIYISTVFVKQHYLLDGVYSFVIVLLIHKYFESSIHKKGPLWET